MLGLSLCLALLIAWVIHERFERRSVERQIAEDTCEQHGIFCCPWCLRDCDALVDAGGDPAPGQ